jgi:hypothetical protein
MSRPSGERLKLPWYLSCGHSLRPDHHQVGGNEPLLPILPRPLERGVNREGIVMSASVADVVRRCGKQVRLGSTAPVARKALEPLRVEQAFGPTVLVPESFHEG